MKVSKEKNFIIKLPKKQYTKELQKMFDFLRYKKATKDSVATQKQTDEIIEAVRKSRNEKKQALQYL